MTAGRGHVIAGLAQGWSKDKFETATFHFHYVKTVSRNTSVLRAVWGSDAPLHHQEIEMKKVTMSALNEEERRKVVGENIAHILKLI